ncbi:MAG: AsmA-like C-terminal domain-containing protein [Desulfobulbaceae bacterium]|nr:AsmA-like C-terminal domain-containing protein [Desulfobulbaceae bacterium]
MESPINSKSRRTIYFLLSVLCILVLAGSVLWWSLKKGVEFDRLSFASTQITQLSLQLDHGLIIHAGQIDITDGGTTNEEASLESWIPQIKKWGYLIQEIMIYQLNYQNHSVAVSYREGNFEISGKEFSLEARVTYDRGAFYFDISRLEIKPYTIIFAGKASYVRKDERFLFAGIFESPWGNGELKMMEKKRTVEAEIRTDEFTDLTAFLQQFPLDEDVLDWLSDNISARTYQINQLHVQFQLNKLHEIGPDNIRGTATADAVAVKFHPDLPPVQCDRAKITFRNDRLSFALENPKYEGKSLEGSSVYIDNVIKPHSTLSVNIKTESQLDNTLLSLLEKYDIKLPFHQLSGLTRGEVNLLFDLPEFTLKTTGSFVTGAGAWSWADVPLQTQKVSVQLTDSRITIHNAEISYSDILRSRLSGLVDISSGHASLENEIEQLNLNARKTDILQAAQMKLPLEIDFSHESTVIDLEQIKTAITLSNEGTTVDIDSLEAVRPLVPILQNLPFSEGNVHLSFNDLSFISFSGELDIPGSILSLEDKPVTLFTFQGTRTPEKTLASVNDDRILINISDRVKVTLNEYLPMIAINNMSFDEKIPSLPLPLEITGPEILLKVKDMQVPTRDFEYRVTGSDMVFTAVLEKGRFLFESTEKKKILVGNGLDAGLAEKFIRFTDLSEGLINVNLEGDAEGYNGYLEFSNVVIREYLLMNNILAFLNSIPALATLSEPGFDHDGYRVKDGIVHFDLQDELLTIRQLRTDGTTVNCEAQGWIDFDDRTIKLNMELITFKDYSRIIDLLPWAGYAFLGEDGSLSTSLKIDGSLDNPTITTYLARDILMTPVNVIRRTIEWPFKIFRYMGEDAPEPPEWVIPTPMVPE